jgi:glycosyltransferase involved in cell wall biosynthesis
MRILQIIDSLDVGGAEKMAINYANALAEEVDFSGIVATRKEGDLKNLIHANVSYLFLNRKKTIDFRALKHLKRYCAENEITHLQPHSSSYFTALLVKFMFFKLKIIWHDHNGLSEFLSSRKSFALKLASYFFDGIITVNYQLKNWAIAELNCKKVIYLPNFTSIDTSIEPSTSLLGIDGKRILCLANLRLQKNQFFLLRIAQRLQITHPEWTFHLVGKDFNDEYSFALREAIRKWNLASHVHLYGTKKDISNIIKQADICVFTSSSEGLPVALLEFGLLSKPVLSTNVGEIPLIIENGKNGYVVDADDENAFYDYLVQLITSTDLRDLFGANLKKTIEANNSKKAIISQYINWIKRP